MRAKLLQQPQINPETTQSHTEQEIIAVSAEIQAEIDENQEFMHKTANQQFSKDELEEDQVLTHHFIVDPKSQEEAELEVDWEKSIEILDPDAKNREDDWNALEVDAARELTGKSAHRPPPKPPNFTSDGGAELRFLTHEIDSTTLGDGKEGLVASNNTEDGAVAQGKVEMELTTSSIARARESVRVEADNCSAVTQAWWCSSREDNDPTDQNCDGCASEVAGRALCNAEVGASSKGNREIWAATSRTASMMEEGGATLIVSSDSKNRGRRALPFVGKPLVLMVAVLPWNREEERRNPRKKVDGVLLSEALGERRGGRLAPWLASGLPDGPVQKQSYFFLHFGTDEIGRGALLGTSSYGDGEVAVAPSGETQGKEEVEYDPPSSWDFNGSGGVAR